MKLRFNVEYHTVFGEELTLNMIIDGNQEKVINYRMSTTDGVQWTCEIAKQLKEGQTLDYYYAVERGGEVIRHEWTVAMHHVAISVVSGKRLTMYDHWHDIPDNSYLYSSAFTDCISRHKVEQPKLSSGDKTVLLRVRAPQLRDYERLAVSGNVTALGKWDVMHVLKMVEHSHNEWVASVDVSNEEEETLEFKFLTVSDKAGYDPMWESSMNRTVELPRLAKGEVVAYELSEAYFPIGDRRMAGTVIPIFSLRSSKSFGIGDFGDLKKMVDWVAQTGQRVLQVLPINDTNISHTWTDSYPYNSISIYALHPQYVDLNQLPELKDRKKMSEFEKLREELNALPQIDYERVNNAKMEYLRLLYAQEGDALLGSDEFKAFFGQNKDWLVPYAAFSHYRDLYGTATFSEWPDHHSLDDKERTAMSNPRTKAYKEVAVWYYIQYYLDKQMREAHEYARSKQVILKGDIPIGISRHSVEAWVEPHYFRMNTQAGAPPDAFSQNGQNWGFPTYDWTRMAQDGYQWWVKRLGKMAEYFDAYRIDHVLGFFRIWQIPYHSVHGLLGHFCPSLPMTTEEIERYGIKFNRQRHTQPYITDPILEKIFADKAAMVKRTYLSPAEDGQWKLKLQYATQRLVEKAFQGKVDDDSVLIRDGLYRLISNVLFVPDEDTPDTYHPRIAAMDDFVFQSLLPHEKEAFCRLHNDYYYQRHNRFWEVEAMKKLPPLVQSTRMLVCAEDLGMVPACVGPVMERLRMLSLEIQTMPKAMGVQFGRLEDNPYRSVATIFTHDMPTLRGWWEEDYNRAQQFFNQMLQHDGPAPREMPGWLCEEVVARHLYSPSMLCLISLQDWLAMDEDLRRQNPEEERINVPATPRHYWRYRMHICIEDLMDATDLNSRIRQLIRRGGRDFSSAVS